MDAIINVDNVKKIDEPPLLNEGENENGETEAAEDENNK